MEPPSDVGSRSRRSDRTIFSWARRLWKWSDPDRPRSAVVLVIANLVPLVGAVILGWNVGAMVVLYWIESVVVGVLNVPKIALARAGSPDSGALATVVRDLAKIAAVPFFIVHYGVFLVGSGGGTLFLAVAAGGSLPPTNGTAESDLRQAFSMLNLPVGGLIAAALGLTVSHLVSFFGDYLGGHEYERVTPLAQMYAPYPRLFVLLAATLSSGLIIAVMGNPVWAVAGFVIGKTWLDLRLLSAQREKAASAGVPARATETALISGRQ